MRLILKWYIEAILGFLGNQSDKVVNGRAILILLIPFLWGQSSYAQKFNIKTYSVNEGLPSGNVYDVHTDENGYLWFASSYGIVRYDGAEFIQFGADEGLKDDLIYDFYFENDGENWVSTEFGGLAKFNGSTFEYLPELAVLDTMVINFISSVRDDELWIGTDEYGVALWDQNSGEIVFITESDGLKSDQIWDIHFSSDNEVWITTMLGISVYDRERGITKSYSVEDGFSGELMYETAEDKMGRKWVATSNGVTIIHPDGSIDTITELDGEELDYVFSIEVDNEGTVWIGTERRGLILIEEDGNKTRIKRQNGLSSNFIYRIIRDDDGTMWVATDGNGISLFKDRNFLRYEIESELNANAVFALKLASDGSIWITTNNGLTNYRNGVFKHFPVPDSLMDEADEIWDIEELPNGDLLLLSYTYEFLQFDGEKFFYPEIYEELYDIYINDVFVDVDGSVWYSAYDQLSHHKDGILTHYTPPDQEDWQTALFYMFRDSREILWIGTEGGLAKFEDGKFEYYDKKFGIPGNSVYDIAEDHNNNLWVGTDGGIAYLTPQSIADSSYQFTSFLSEELFTKESVFLFFDSKGGLWQGTNAGLNYFDLTNWDYSSPVVQIHHPLLDNRNAVELNGPARIEDENGTLWFGTYSHGLITFNYPEGESTVESSNAPKLFLRQILADTDTIYNQTRQFENLDDLEIAHSMNDLTFFFNAINYTEPYDISYRYKLAGYDNDWNYAVGINEVRYTNLPPGNYDLHVQAKSIKSDWNEVTELASFAIQKPYYLTIPFFVVVFAMIIFIIFAYVNFRISRIEKRELQKLVDQQTKDLSIALSEKEVLIKEIHHRVKNNLAVVSGLLELQGFRMPAGSAKMAIQESKMRVIAMSKIHENLYQNHDLAHVNFKKFISELVNSIRATMDIIDKEIEVVLYMEEVLLDVNVGIPLGLITNELVSNSYKHAFNNRGEGTITISFSELNGEYELSVSDNGVGAPVDVLERSRKSLGVTLIKSLTSQINGNLIYSNDIGSTFTLTVPVDQDKKAPIF